MLYLDCWQLQNCPDKHLRDELLQVTKSERCWQLQVKYHQYFTFNAEQRIPISLLRERCAANPSIPLDELFEWFGLSVMQLAPESEQITLPADALLHENYQTVGSDYDWLTTDTLVCITAYQLTQFVKKYSHLCPFRVFVLTEEAHAEHGRIVHAVLAHRIDWSQ